MNPRRILLAGTTAGMFMLASGVALGHGVLGPAYIRAFASHRVHPPGAGTVVENTLLRLGFGFLAAFLYAAMRPRFGPGPRTALVAGFTLWLAAYVPATLALVDFGILKGWWTAVVVPWGLAEALLGTLLGGWIYRESPLRGGTDG